MRSFRGTLTSLVVLTVAVAGVALMQGWTTWFEAIGFVSGAVCVWLTSKENIWNWPIGLLNVAAYTYVFFQARLFADAGLQILYFVLGVLGWYWWLHGGANKSELKIDHTPRKQWPILFVVALGATIGMADYLWNVHDAAPYLDAATTVLSLVAQYLLTRKYIENWLIWILVDIVYVPLYAWKGLYLTAILYAIFTVMAVGGLREWARLRAEQTGREPVVPMWNATRIGLTVGIVVALWMGWKCWVFETFYPATDLAILRASERAERIDGPDTRFKLDETQFLLLKASMLDPLIERSPTSQSIEYFAGDESVTLPRPAGLSPKLLD